jgi:putative glutamine amidotransferase
MTPRITIGITECGKWDKYASWIQSGNSELNLLKLSWRENKLVEVERCHGVVLTGGEDVHPRFYGAAERVRELDPKEVNEQRDEFELRVIDAALKKGIPLLGICRGLQITNVYFGGNLIIDIPSTGKPDHAKSQGYDRQHPVNVLPGTQLASVIGVRRGEVNSAHHQAADKTGNDVRVSATSDDGIIEGLEWKDPKGKSFLLLIQWHPERMQDFGSPFSKNVLFEFLHAASEKE